jgi:DNA repair protein RadA/Sms
VSQGELRVKEAGKLGFTRCLLPRNNLEKLAGKPALELIGVSSLQEGLGVLF